MVYLFSYKNRQIFLLNSAFRMHFLIKSNQESKVNNLKNSELAREFVTSLLKYLGIENYLIKFNDIMSEIEIIPVIGSLSELNVLDKFQKHYYIFWKEYLQNTIHVDQDMMLIILNAYQQAITVKNKIENIPYKFFNDQIIYTNINKLISTLQESSHLLNLEKLTIPNNLPVNFTKCPFDDPKIVYNQLVLETNYFNLLVNIGPYSKCHFIITPKISFNNYDLKYQHDYRLESWEFLSLEQKMEAYKLCLDLSRIITHVFKLKSIIFLHNGSAAGQTVAHTHLHVLTIPDKQEYFKKISNEIINFNCNKTNLNLDYIYNMKNEVGSILYQYRIMNRSPITFHLGLKSTKKLKINY